MLTTPDQKIIDIISREIQGQDHRPINHAVYGRVVLQRKKLEGIVSEVGVVVRGQDYSQRLDLTNGAFYATRNLEEDDKPYTYWICNLALGRFSHMTWGEDFDHPETAEPRYLTSNSPVFHSIPTLNNLLDYLQPEPVVAATSGR
jgi:hypothetical protein